MRIKLRLTASGMLFIFVAGTLLRADQLEMQNGDRYNGKVLSVSTETVVLESEVLGKINVPRKNVTSLAFGTNTITTKAATTVARLSVVTNLPVAALPNTIANTNADLSAAFRNLGGDTNFIRQIREQMLADSPEAARKYNEMVNGLITGKLNMNDLRREAKSSADQLRALKRDLGPEVGDSLDMYLQVLDGFLKESPAEPASAAPAPQPKVKGR
ncbi:MAG: hypothetical protein HOP33_07700 [Verrucomicrobia bacterium]|nr:hypothetical protein [Verrucomicrobiota bacterium]